MRIDLGCGMYRPEADQLKGACKNYYTPERWVDISNQVKGVTWITLDAPVIETGDITTDANAYGWVQEAKPSRTILSYVMNNYWGTNYKAGQEGKTLFRYVVIPHEMFISQDAEKRAAEESEPLVISIPGQGKKEKIPPLALEGRGIIITSLIPDDDGYLVHLYNACPGPSVATLKWKDVPKEVFFCDYDGNRTGEYSDNIMIPGWGTRVLRVRR
jgi:hypothetical protein